MTQPSKTRQFLEAAFEETNLNTQQSQLAKLYEEIAELTESMKTPDAGIAGAIQNIAFYSRYLRDRLSQLNAAGTSANIQYNHLALLDGLCDVAFMAENVAFQHGHDYAGAKDAVDTNNLTKVVDGKLLRDESGMIIKPEGYEPVDLTPFLNPNL